MSKLGLGLLGVAAIALSTSVPAARAWGCKGHETVAYLAAKHLTPEAQQFVLSLLNNNPSDPSLKRYCSTFAASDVGDQLALAATWADDYRSLDSTVNKEHPTGPWHFIDIPLDAPATAAVGKFCTAAGCVTKAITEQLAILHNKNAASADRANALRFLVHFVGDIHQPLHASDNDDRGGNCVPVRYLRRNPRLSKGVYTPNLHHIWDTEMVEKDMEGADPSEFAATLESRFSGSFADWQQGGVEPEQWALEGHQMAIDSAYGAFAVHIPFEPEGVEVKRCTDDNNIARRMLSKHVAATASYIDAVEPVIEERLAQAGIRLAMLLNEAATSR
jgi:hypothetical protein